jgi:hypothetical protein
VSGAALLIAGCSQGSSTEASGPREGPPESVFQRERRIEVNIELAPRTARR